MREGMHHFLESRDWSSKTAWHGARWERILVMPPVSLNGRVYDCFAVGWLGLELHCLISIRVAWGSMPGFPRYLWTPTSEKPLMFECWTEVVLTSWKSSTSHLSQDESTSPSLLEYLEQRSDPKNMYSTCCLEINPTGDESASFADTVILLWRHGVHALQAVAV